LTPLVDDDVGDTADDADNIDDGHYSDADNDIS